MGTNALPPIDRVIAKRETPREYSFWLYREGQVFGQPRPFDPTLRPGWGTLKAAKALAAEHGVPLVIV